MHRQSFSWSSPPSTYIELDVIRLSHLGAPAQPLGKPHRFLIRPLRPVHGHSRVIKVAAGSTDVVVVRCSNRGAERAVPSRATTWPASPVARTLAGSVDSCVASGITRRQTRLSSSGTMDRWD